MSSLKSKLVIFMIQNRNLLKGQIKREVITRETDTVQMRKEFESAATKIPFPTGVKVAPVTIPGLAEGLAAEWIYPENGPDRPAAGTRAMFYTHGGGYVSGNCIDHRMHVAKFVQATGIPALLYDYRLAPEYPFPAGMQDTQAAYRWLLAQGVEPQRLAIVGESAGAGLCLAALLAIRDEGLPLPAAGVALSPWTDLARTGESYRSNAQKDISTLGSWDVWGDYYVGDNDPRNPWISPLYGDLAGLPPIFIQVGTHEILLDDALRFAAKAKSCGTDVTLSVWPGMVHCFALLAPMFPEATQAWEEVIAYIRKALPG